MMGFGDRLRQARQAAGMSQAELAERADLDPPQLSHFERHARLPSFLNLVEIVRALPGSAEYLLGVTPRLDGAALKLDRIRKILEE